ILVRQRGSIDGVILEVEGFDAELSGEPIRAHQRSEAGVRADVWFALHGQQLTISPKVVRTRLDRAAGDFGADARVVVGHFERTEAGLAHVQRLDRILLPAFAAFEIGDVAHGLPSSLRAIPAGCEALVAAPQS